LLRKYILIIFCMVLLLSCVTTQRVPESGINAKKYEIKTIVGYTMLSKYFGNDEDINIADDLSGIPINSIESKVFMNKEIKSVILPVINAIGNATFENNSLNSIDLKKGLEIILPRAFYNNDIEYIIFPSSIKFIGPNAFANNPITSILLPVNNMSLGNEDFEWFGQRYKGNLIEEKGPAFDNGFDEFYISNGRRAGLYNLNKNTKEWSIQLLEIGKTYSLGIIQWNDGYKEIVITPE